MAAELSTVRAGLAIVLLGLFLGIGLGITFGADEDAYQDYIAAGIAAHPDVHDARSQNSIWRYAQRAHFHAGGVAAFSLGLIILVMFSDMARKLKRISSILIGLGSLYPMAWLSMFFLAPAIGRGAAHEHFLTEFLTYVGVGALLLGSFLLLANLFLGLFRERSGA